jgi:hypothetical protein
VRAGATGIEIEHPVARLLLGDVAVAGDQDFEACRFGLQVELRQIVQDVDGNAADLQDLGFR